MGESVRRVSRFRKLGLRRIRRLTAGTTDHEHPAWSPDGRTLAFSAGSVDSRAIYLVDRKGRFVDAVAPKGPRATRPRWAPDGRRLAFDALPPDGPPLILIQDLPELGHDPQALVRGRRGGAGHAAFSPDGRFVAFISDDRPNAKTDGPVGMHLWLLDLESGERRQLTEESGLNDAHPAFSPDGALLAFHRYLGEHATQSSIFLLNVSTGALMRLTDSPAFDKHPCFATPEIVIFHRESPDGAQELRAVHALDGDEVGLQGKGPAAGLDAKQPAVRITRRGGLRVAFAGRRRDGTGLPESPRPYDLYAGALVGLDGTA